MQQKTLVLPGDWCPKMMDVWSEEVLVGAEQRSTSWQREHAATVPQVAVARVARQRAHPVSGNTSGWHEYIDTACSHTEGHGAQDSLVFSTFRSQVTFGHITFTFGSFYISMYYVWLGVTCTHKNQTLTFDNPSEAPFQCVELMIVMAVCTQAQ